MSERGAKAREAERLLPQRVIDRVLSRVVKTDDGCLLSTYSPQSDGGYRQIGFRVNGVNYKLLTHRVAWVAEHGPIPDGLTVHHKCFQTACVNVDHLELMETYENTRRQGGQDWPLGECQRGHLDSELVWESGQRVCKPCRHMSVTRRRKEKRAQTSPSTAAA